MLLGLRTVHVLGQILPLALFIGILLTLGRWYRDSEMAVLAACGIGIRHFVRPLLLLAAGFTLVASLFALYLSPLAIGLTAKAKSENVNRQEVSGIAPGVFNEIKDGGGFFYVEQVSRDSATLSNIFSSRVDDGRHGVMLAKSGYQHTDEKTGDRFLVFKDGTRYEGVPGRAVGLSLSRWREMPFQHPEEVTAFLATKRTRDHRTGHSDVAARDTARAELGPFHARERGGFCGIWNIESPAHRG